MPAAVFWDMDGTMVDSEPLWGEATYALSERLGKRLTPELRASTVGGSFRNTLEVCARHAGYSLSEKDYEEQRTILYNQVKSLFAERLVPLPGVKEVLTDLRMHGVPMYVTTNTEREIVDHSLGAVGEEFFHGSVAGDEVPHQKPAPDMYLRAAELAAAQPSACLVFEDSTNGMKAAISAGCRVIGLPSQPGQDIPEGVVLLSELRAQDGCPESERNGFVGVSAADIQRWFGHICTL